MTELLLDCLRPGDDRALAARLATMQAGAWQALLHGALAQQVVGLVYQRVKALGLSAPPALEALRTLQMFYALNAARNVRIRDELRTIAAALNADHQSILLLKGAHLAYGVYDDLGLRQMVDIDLLVPRDNLARVAHILENHGYAAQSRYVLDQAFFDSHLHLPPFAQQGRTTIELHWNITAPQQTYSIDPRDLWQRAVPVCIGDLAMRGLCAEDLLLHACFHAAYQHEFEFGLRPFCDIAQIIRRHDNLCWSDVVARARAWRWTRGVALALHVAQDMVGADVPAQVLRDLRPDVLPDTVLLCARTQVLTAVTAGAALSPNVVAWHDAAWHKKITLLVRNVCVPKAVLARLYGVRATSPAVYLYYPVRLLALVARYSRTLFNLWRGTAILPPRARSKHTLHDWLAGTPQ
ncbi:MAG: nucleotidyltransferase family protein [bacterium]|nr:nucleotidyltransferase family protein [bacterium]